MEKAQDKQFDVYDRFYKSSNLINISSYFKDYTDLINTSDFHTGHNTSTSKFDPRVFNLIGDGIDEKKYEILAKHCNIQELTVEGEIEKCRKNTFRFANKSLDKSIIHKLGLLTLKNVIKRNRLPKYYRKDKYKTEMPIIYEENTEKSPDDQYLKPETDSLVSIRVYHTFTGRTREKTILGFGKLVPESVIEIPGSLTLDKLKDIIICDSDNSVSTEVSKNPDLAATAMAKDLYPSSFFFIENVFYNDFRIPNSNDNSFVLKQWMENHNFGSPKIDIMEKTRIDSLVTRFGYPFVYQHQGDCEHLICFSNARLVNACDELNINSYPRIVKCSRKAKKVCLTCGVYLVKWIVLNSDRIPHNPCLLCDSCFKSYNYIKGKKVGIFEAYPYPHNASLKAIAHVSAQSETLTRQI